MNPAIKRIQIFGERCSGTNYLQHLLEKNLESIIIRWNFGWKHFFHEAGVEEADEHLFIIIYRNPFDWLRSLNNNPHHAAPELRKNTFSDFIRKEWWCIWDEHANKTPDDDIYGTEMMFEREPETGQRFANVMRLRTAKIRDWESLREKTKHNIYVRYEDLAAQPQAFLETLCEQFGVALSTSFANVEGRPGTKRKYRPRKYKPIKEYDLRYIMQELDLPLEERIGYSVEALAAELNTAPDLFSAVLRMSGWSK